MRRNYLALWSILAVSFIIFFTLSTCDDIPLGGWKLKTSELSSIFKKPEESPGYAIEPDTLSMYAQEEDKEASADTISRCLDTTPKTVLMIGDSMLEGLTPRLAAYCNASDYKLYSVIWYSSSSELYGETHLLSDYIRLLHPDYIFISLGGNELFVSDVAAKRKKYVRSIVQEIGDIPFLWIGPPNWKPDTGINDLIASNVPEGCFFLSDGMQFERKRDGAHPTQASATVWMDSVLRWMPDHARTYMEFKQPTKTTQRPERYYIHAPGALKERPI